MPSSTTRPYSLPPSLRVRRSLVAVGVGMLVFGLSGCTVPQAGSEPSSSATGPSASASAGPPTGTAGSFAGLEDVPGVVTEIEPSVVTIRTPIGLGSGVIYRGNGTIVTAGHVVEDEKHNPFQTVQVLFADGQTSKAKVIAVDHVTDLGVLKAGRGGLPAAKFASHLPTVGELAVVVGSPLGLTETVTAGIVSGLHRSMPRTEEAPQGLFNLFQTDAAISPGNSGGAVVDGDAIVIGLAEAYLPPQSGAVSIGFATPSIVVTSIVDQLLKDGKASHPYLGIVPSNISPQLAQRYNLPSSTGVLVVTVADDSPAETAGLKPGDIITKFDGQPVDRVLDLLGSLRKRQPHDAVPIVIERDGDSRTLTVTLGSR